MTDQEHADHKHQELDDLTIDGTDLLRELALAATGQGANGANDNGARNSGDTDERTVTDPRPAGERWAPVVQAPAASTEPVRIAGFTRLQLGVIACTFAVGAVVGLVIGLSRGDASDPSPAIVEASE